MPSQISPYFQAVTKLPAPQKRVRPAPLSVRLSEEERAQLKERAGTMSVNAYVRAALFGKRKAEVAHYDHKLLAQVLGRLGQSELSLHFQDMAEAAKMGALHVTPEVELAILDACEQIAWIKSVVMSALHIKER